MSRPDIVSVHTATRCSCGEAVVVSHYSTAREQFAYCPRCYDPSEGTADIGRVCGHGATVDEALWSWAEQHETVHEVEWVPNPMWSDLERQIKAEASRQRGLTIIRGAPFIVHGAATVH